MPRPSRRADPTAWSPYGRHTDRAPGSTLPADQHGSARNGAAQDDQYDGATYYDRPVVKRSHYGWLIASYLFIGGLAGAAQIIATLADLLGGRRDRGVVRAGRYVALTGALVSPVLLIADLHARSRWYNMLRIFRRTSPMSIGSWTLATFGALSGLVAVGQLGADLLGLTAGRRLARWASVPAAGAGALMSVYTGTLLAATSVPLWSAGLRLLSPLFGATSFATAAAALSLVGQAGRMPSPARRRLSWIGLAATLAQLGLSRALERRWRAAGLSPVVDDPAARLAYQGGVVGLGMLVPLVLQAVALVGGRRWAGLTSLAAVATLGGGFAERALIVFGGNRTADRPALYFGLTQPGSAARPPGRAGLASEQVGARP